MSSTVTPAECGDVSRGTIIVAVETCLATVIIILGMMRFYVRAVVVKSPGLDDASIAVAMITYLAVYGMDLQEVNWGAGRHLECIPPENTILAGRYQYISEPILIASLLFSRISFCLFLLRIFSVQKIARIVIYVLMAIIFAIAVASASVTIPQCTPRAKLWNPAIPGTCWSPNTELSVGYFNGAASAVCDLALALLPIYFLSTILMRKSTKVLVCLLMGLGAFTAVCAIVRTILLSGIKGTDVTYDIANITIFAVLEGAMAIIAATVPTLKPLFSHEFMLANNQSSSYPLKRPFVRNHNAIRSDTQQMGSTLTKGSGASQTAVVTSQSSGRNGSTRNVDHVSLAPLQEGEVLRKVDIEVTRQDC